MLQDVIQDVCKYVADVIQKYLPQEFESLRIYCDVLPLYEKPSTYHFAGFVLNLQVSTLGHIDGGDDTICVVIPFGTFIGGELGLHEAGLLFGLQPGDIIIFPSYWFSHFNMHFKGVQGSLVMHSDKEGKRWAKTRNDWASKMVVKN